MIILPSNKSIVWLFKPSVAYLEQLQNQTWLSWAFSFLKHQPKFNGGWECLPNNTIHTIENLYRAQASGEHNLFYVPPFSRAAHMSKINVDFTNMTIKSASIFGDLKREEQTVIFSEREKIDNDLGVKTFAFSPSPFEFGSITPISKKEKLLVSLSQSIREKPNWEQKYKNIEIVNKWREESKSEITEDMFDFVLKELAYYETLKYGSIEPASVESVWQADSLISEDLRQEFLREMEILEKNLENEKDWHPGSNQQVLDIVHPSLFCVVDRVSPVFIYPSSSDVPVFINFSIDVAKLDRDEEIKQLEEEVNKLTFRQKDYEREAMFLEDKLNFMKWNTGKLNEISTKSKKYQWLPADVQVDNTGKCSFLSYINNLDPGTNQPLYDVLSKILTSFVPMFERVMTDLNDPRPPRYNPYPWDSGDTEVNLPPLPSFTPPPQPELVSLNGRRIQVIVKLANIVLTPEKPAYNGGVWHVEGMQNERIIASGIYYYELEFRAAIDDPEYEQDDGAGVEAVYGLKNEGPLNQEMGSLITKEGRCISFPNIYQHKVAPFQLIDTSKPGIRKILVFFLVDPADYILSSHSVPPQQPTWRKEETILNCKPWNSLPKDQLKEILEKSPTMTREEAERHREELMKERKYVTQETTKISFERPFSLCEH